MSREKNTIYGKWNGFVFLDKQNLKNEIDLNAFVFQLQSTGFQRDFSKKKLPEGLLDQIKAFLKEEHPSLVRAALGDEVVKRKLADIISQYISENKITKDYKHSLGEIKHQELVSLMVDDIAGFGPLDQLFSIPTLTDININRIDNIWIDDYETGPRKVDVKFESIQEYEKLLSKIMNAAGVSYNYSHPQISGALPRFRFDIVGFDLTDQPTCSIRILSKELRINDESIVSSGQVSSEMLLFLKELMRSRVSLSISGATGTGKTELIRYLFGFSPEWLRIITIEDIPEMMLEFLYPDRNISSWITRLKLMEDSNIDWDLATMTKIALRHYPKIIAIGETRDKELYHLLKAGETDHTIITGIHAEEGKIVERMTSIIDEYLPGRTAIHQRKVANTLPINIHLDRIGENEKRVVTQIAEYQDCGEKGIRENVLFKFDRENHKHVQVGRLSEKLSRKFRTSNLVNEENIAFLLSERG